MGVGRIIKENWAKDKVTHSVFLLAQVYYGANI